MLFWWFLLSFALSKEGWRNKVSRNAGQTKLRISAQLSWENSRTACLRAGGQVGVWATGRGIGPAEWVPSLQCPPAGRPMLLTELLAVEKQFEVQFDFFFLKRKRKAEYFFDFDFSIRIILESTSGSSQSLQRWRTVPITLLPCCLLMLLLHYCDITWLKCRNSLAR